MPFALLSILVPLIDKSEYWKVPVYPALVERVECAGDDVFRGLAPDEGLRLSVVLQQVVVGRAWEIIDAGVAAAADAICGDLGEEALDEVHAVRAGRCETQFEAGMLFQPGLHIGRLEGCLVVENQMVVARFLHGPVNATKKAQEPLAAVAWHAFPDDQARSDFQSGEERGDAMALVVVGHGRRASLPHQGQPGLGPVESLDLGFLVHAQHYRTVRRIEIKPDNLCDLRLEHRAVQDLEPLHDMRLQPGIRPYALDARRRNTHASAIIVRLQCVASGDVFCTLHDLHDQLQRDLPRLGRHEREPCLVSLETRHTFIEIPFLPAPDRRLRHARPPHDLDGSHVVNCRQHDPGLPCQLAWYVAVAK